MKRFGTTVLTALTAVLLWGADGRRKLWDLDLSIFVDHAKDAAALVWGVRFSADESKAAIGFGPSWDGDPRPQRLVVVTVEKPQTVVREFELNIERGRWISGGSIVWSPSGAILVVRTQTPTMFRLSPGAPCVFPKESEFGGFLSEDRMAIYLRRFQEPTEIQILRPDCSLADSWKIDGQAHVLDTSPEQGLLAILTSPNPSELATELVASRTHEVKQRWIWESGMAAGAELFSDQGRLLCGSKHLEGKPLPDVACWDTQTGAKTAENDKVGVELQPIESAGGDLLAITDYKYVSLPLKGFWEFFDTGSSYTAPRRRPIWSVRTGKEVASWGLGGLQQKQLLRDGSTRKSSFVLSLSPTGKYLAEGGSGSVSAYAVQR